MPPSPPASPSILPVELLYLIPSYLADDRVTLFHLSLVSRLWVSPAQYHLFHAITLDLRDDPSFYLTHFATTLPANLAALVRDLTIVQDEFVPYVPPSNLTSLDGSCHLSSLMAALGKLPYLENLTLRDLILSDDGPTNLLQQKPLSKLVLHEVRGFVHDFNAVLSCFPSVKSLYILHIAVYYDGNTPENPHWEFHPRWSDIESLTISSHFENQSLATGAFIVALLSALPRLKSLEARSSLSSSKIYDGVRALIRERGEHLWHLRLNAFRQPHHGFQGLDRDLSGLDLSRSCPRLEVLHIQANIYFLSMALYTPANVSQLGDIKTLISQAPRQSIQTIVLELDVPSPGDQDLNMGSVGEGLRVIDEILPEFESLQTFRIQWDSNPMAVGASESEPLPDYFKEFLEMCFSRARQRGVLKLI